MERLQALILDSCFMDDSFADMEYSQHGLFSDGSFRLNVEEEQVQVSDSIIEDKNPFLQMLQRVEPTTCLPLSSEPNILQSVLQTQTLEQDSCLTLETIPDDYKPFKLGSMLSSPSPTPPSTFGVAMDSVDPGENPKTANARVKERRKRKRTKAPKNIEDVENQRMTHIAVERNRRRQMNDHLNSLRSLMPLSYLQRGDQASIIGGAIDFIKELEQMLHFLEGEKGIKTGEQNDDKQKTLSSHACSSSSVSSISTSEDGLPAANGENAAEVDTSVIQNHVNLKIRCKRRQGQILRVIVSLEELKFTILHLNVTSSSDIVFYSLNLKMEDDCQLGSADEITAAVHQIFKHINNR